MSEPQVFEFEVAKRDQRFVVSVPNKVLRQMKVKDDWQNRAEFGIATSHGIHAMLTERTNREKCWQDLMARARGMCAGLDGVPELESQLDALEAEWERGGV